MSLTTPISGNKVTQWDSEFFVEYVRDMMFTRYMGTNENAVIQVKENLTKQKGDKISIPLITRLAGKGVRGNAKLQGNEEALGNYNHDIPVFPVRNGVAVTEWDEQRTVIDLRNAAKQALKTWIMGLTRDDIITALMSFGANQAHLASQVVTDSSYAALASTAVKDAFLAANSDRFLFGAVKSNGSSNVLATSLANVDSTNDKLSATIVSLAKRIAKNADPHIRPIQTAEGEEWFVMFCNSYAFRDLKADTVISAANRDGWQRYNEVGMDGGTSPLFRGGDLIYDGVIIREIPEIPVITGAGASSIDVAPNFLCGAQALAMVWAQRTKSRTNTEDYGFENGVAISEMRGIEKLIYNGKQNGVVTVYTSGVADT